MAKPSPRVFLDACIPRDMLAYTTPVDAFAYPISNKSPQLRLHDLMDPTSAARRRLRKPDFQRATSAWTQEHCLQLIDSFLQGLAIPAIVMWSSPEHDYILDGGHRVSVMIAWFDDNWGEKTPIQDDLDDEQRENVKQTARAMRKLVKDRVGPFAEYRSAHRDVTKIRQSGQDPRSVVDASVWERARLYERMEGQMHFPVVWAEGTVVQAQASYVRINRLGEAVTTWETLVIEHRNSAFVRVLMATVQNARLPYYWPDDPSNQAQIEEVRADIRALHDLVLLPVPKARTASGGVPLTYPLLHGTPDEKLEWFQEMMTIALGGEGKSSEVERWFQVAEGETLARQGTNLIKQVRSAFDHLTGDSPKSLGIVPLLYTYNAQGTYVRGLLYGIWYWLLAGNADAVLARKRLFCIYRRQIEEVLLMHKADIIHRYSRKVGSGPKVTEDVALFYQELLTIFIQHNGDLTSAPVQSTIQLLLRAGKATKEEEEVDDDSFEAEGSESEDGGGERFTRRDKKVQRILTQLQHAPQCAICGGLMDVAQPTQDDHIREHARGGKRDQANQRLSHPFCNNQRTSIEKGRDHPTTLSLPPLS